MVSKKAKSRTISTGVNMLWKAVSPKASRFGVRARAGNVCSLPRGFPCGPFRVAGSKVAPTNWMDSRALFGSEQAKSERGHVRTFTQHSQLFHKPRKCASSGKRDEIPNDSNCFLLGRKAHCPAMVQLGLRKSEVVSYCFLSGRRNSKTPRGSAPIRRRSSSTSMTVASSRAPSGV